MGDNAVLVVLNDRLDEIERDPEFGKKVAAAIRGFRRRRSDAARIALMATGAVVVSVEHADTRQVVEVSRNNGRLMRNGA
jgi:fructose-1,6-bisphosphatase/inositol monophosphatase family enzyme